MRCDTKQFADMYEEIYTDLYRFALCMMKNVPDAEDAVSEAVLAAYENIGKLRKKEAFKSWIFTILANTCKKKLKEAGKRKAAETGGEKAGGERKSGEAGYGETVRGETSHGEIPGEHPDYGLALDVKNAFFILSEEEQEIVALSVFGGYNSKEIAKMLRLNASTVRSKRSRALVKMECVLR